MRIFAAALLLGVAAPLAAQQTSADTAGPATQGYAPAGPVSTPSRAAPEAIAGKIVLPARTEAQLQEGSAAADEDLRRADARFSRAKENQVKSKALLDQRRLDLREVETKIEQAKKDKRDSDKRALERQKKDLERQKQWAERLETVDQGEQEAARDASLTALARQQAIGLERQLAQARAGSSGGAAGGKPLSRESSDLLIRQLELQTLEAQLKYQKLAHQLAADEEDLAGKRIELYKSARQ